MATSTPAPDPDDGRHEPAELRGSFWPSEQQRLLLRVALLPDEGSERAWREVRPNLHVERLEKGSSMLLPLIYERLEARGVSDVALPKMKGVYRFVWAANQIQLAAFRDLLDTLREAGFETIVFGAARLATGYYGSPGARRVVEPALLVKPVAAHAALRTLEREGWVVAPARSDRHRTVGRTAAGEDRTCSVHWRLPPELDRDLEGPQSAEAFWAAAAPTDIRGVPTASLTCTDELLVTCVNGAKSGGVSKVQWVADAVTILNRAGAEIDWDRIVHQASARRCALRLRDALGYLASALDAPVPTGVLDALDREPSSKRERLAHRISGRGGGVLGNVLPLLAAHMVATQERSVAASVVTFPRELRSSWGLEHLAQLPGSAIRRGRAAISSEREFRRHRR